MGVITEKPLVRRKIKLAERNNNRGTAYDDGKEQEDKLTVNEKKYILHSYFRRNARSGGGEWHYLWGQNMFTPNQVLHSKDLDYFDFTQHCHLSQKKDTNAHYTSILLNLKRDPDMRLMNTAQNSNSIFKVGTSVRVLKKRGRRENI